MFDDFVFLQNVLSSESFLHLSLSTDSILLQTDASGVGLGAVLNVVRGEQELVVVFWSQNLSRREKNYPVSGLECLAIIDAILHFAPYPCPASFVVETDHRVLSFLWSASFINGRLARWAMKLLPYSFIVRYRPGALHHNADTLSRLVRTDEDLPPSDVEALLHSPQTGFQPAASTLPTDEGTNTSTLPCAPEDALRADPLTPQHNRR